MPTLFEGPDATIVQRPNQVDWTFPVEEGIDYIAETDKTASNVFRFDHVGQAELINALQQFAAAAIRLDMFKKAMFRNRSRYEAGLSFNGHTPDAMPSSAGPPLDQLIAGMGHDDLFHGVIGTCTEAGEMAEILIKLLDGRRPDITNVREEIGDVLWYLSRLVKWADTTFLTEMKRNIAKLRLRHGDSGFDRDRDITRDLGAERNLLEGES